MDKPLRSGTVMIRVDLLRLSNGVPASIAGRIWTEDRRDVLLVAGDGQSSTGVTQCCAKGIVVFTVHELTLACADNFGER